MLHGSQEGIFSVLPASVLENLHRPGSENALLWNLIYPLACPHLSLQALLALQPLWGTRLSLPEDRLRAYFWGYDVSGRPLAGLVEAVEAVDGPGRGTEPDLVLLGERTLVMAEVKHGASPGRCGRYQRGRCPEVYGPPVPACRYWEIEGALFDALLDFGPRPSPEGRQPPPCARHYQLARTLLLGTRLAERRGLELHLWLILPESRWRGLERAWLDFVNRVKDSALWRRCRVLAWEAVAGLGGRGAEEV